MYVCIVCVVYSLILIISVHSDICRPAIHMIDLQRTAN